MGKKLRVAILFGGKSGEHEVSLRSAVSVMRAIDVNRFEVIPIGITKEGIWKLGKESLSMLDGLMNEEEPKQMASQMPEISSFGSGYLPSFQAGDVDVVFPVLHGTYGEDGTIQGMLEVAQLPYVGAGVMASAVGMDKIMAKKIFANEGIPQCRFIYFTKSKWQKNPNEWLTKVEEEIGYPCFVKPANLGSSVGISKAKDRRTLQEAIELAAEYDRKILVEEFIPAHEVEVAVLGNDEPEASVPGEIVSSNEFYDYRAKYIDGKSIMRIPADFSPETLETVRSLALQAYKAIDCSGLARVDFFIRKDTKEVLLNEINTMPGFTQFSMYAKLWEHSGLSYTDLISKLIDLAMERYQEKLALKTTFEVE